METDETGEWGDNVLEQFSESAQLSISNADDDDADRRQQSAFDLTRWVNLSERANKTKIEGELRIHNVLALAVLQSSRKIELDEAVKLFKNAIYNPEFFPALRIEIKGPITQSVYTISYYDSGRIQSAGGCMPREAGLCMKQVARRLRSRLGVTIKFKNFEIHNLLAVLDMGCCIDLHKLYSLAPGQKGFEPSRFPALRVSLPVRQPESEQSVQDDANRSGPQSEPPRAGSVQERRAAARTVQKSKRKVETVTASIFSNGKINFVGGKSVKSIVTIIDDLRPFIEACTG